MSMKSGRWEPVALTEWRDGRTSEPIKAHPDGPGKVPSKASGRAQKPKTGANLGKGQREAKKPGFIVIKTERLPDGRTKQILKDKASGRITERIE